MVTVLGVVLVLISIGTIVGPVAGAVLIYHDDLSQLVITPEIRDIMNGNSTILPNSHSSDNSVTNDNVDSDLDGLMKPVFVSAQADVATRTFTATFTLTNTLNYDLTLNSFRASAEITQDHIQAGNMMLSNPVAVPAGETSQLTISGIWTPAARDYITNNYSSISSFELYIVNAEINVNGILIQYSGSIDVGNIPINMVG